MKKILLSLSLSTLCLFAFSQSTITLDFSAKDSATQSVILLDSVYLFNQTLNCDTILTGDSQSFQLISFLGIDDNFEATNESFSISQPFPNPFSETTSVRLELKDKYLVKTFITDLSGRKLTQFSGSLSSGYHDFRISTQRSGVFYLTFLIGNKMHTIKIANTGSLAEKNIIELISSGQMSFKSGNTSGFRFEEGNTISVTSKKTGYYDKTIIFIPDADTTIDFLLSPIIIPPVPATIQISDTVSNITQNSAKVHYYIMNDGGAAVTEHGVCWSLYHNPTIDSSHIQVGTGLGAFETVIDGLQIFKTYFVKGYAINSAGVVYSDEISFNTLGTGSALEKLSGTDSKTWKLLRDVSTGRYPIECGPADHSAIWWAQGLNNDEMQNRPCMFDDEFTFKTHGQKMERRMNNSIWAEGGGWFYPESICAETDGTLSGPNGENLNSWADGNFDFSLAGDKLTIKGYGAYCGFYKLGFQGGLSGEYRTPSDSVIYSIVKLTDGTVDTLIIEGLYADGIGYWRHILVHYDNPDDEPLIPFFPPHASFSYTLQNKTITCTNTSQNSTNYHWDFGDGSTSVEINPVHTYVSHDYYKVNLIADNNFASDSISKIAIVGTDLLTDQILKAGSWHIPVAENVIFVGPGLGSADWWSVPLKYLDGTYAGTQDDWSCIVDDEFTFSNGGVYSYSTNGSTRNEGWWGDIHGCIDDASIAASPAYGPELGSCADHSYMFTPASGNYYAFITLANGTNHAAFIGFNKGYYGGENTSCYNMPNGGQYYNKYDVLGYYNHGSNETLILSVDISYDHSGSAAWTVVLRR